MLSKKEKGNLALAKTIAELVSQKIHVSIPIEENLKYDLISELNGICKTVQVKYGNVKNNNESIQVDLRSTWSNSKKCYANNRKIGDYNILAIYDNFNDRVYFIDDKDFENKSAITIKLKENKTLIEKYFQDFVDAVKIWSKG